MLRRQDGVNPSEKYLSRLCNATFLNLWCYPNVFRAPGKELCDLLVVCGDSVIVFSIKSCEYTDTGRPLVDWKRWYRRTILESIGQISGAERRLRDIKQQLFLDSKCNTPLPIELPAREACKFHRVVVALGSRDHLEETAGDKGAGIALSSAEIGDEHPFMVGSLTSGGGFVHFFDEAGLDVVMAELDTVSDILNYLTKRARLLGGSRKVRAAGEQELVARFMSKMEADQSHGFRIPAHVSEINFKRGMWESFVRRPEVIRKKVADRVSYLWDGIINEFTKHLFAGTLRGSIPESYKRIEVPLRLMAMEPRISRRFLSEAILKRFEGVPHGHAAYRILGSMANKQLGYVLCLIPGRRDTDEERRNRVEHMSDYCFALAEQNREYRHIVGISTESVINVPERSWDLCYHECEGWTDEMVEEAREFREITGLLNPSNIIRRGQNVSEYPGTFAASGGRGQCPCGSGRREKNCCGVGKRKSR